MRACAKAGWRVDVFLYNGVFRVAAGGILVISFLSEDDIFIRLS